MNRSFFFLFVFSFNFSLSCVQQGVPIEPTPITMHYTISKAENSGALACGIQSNDIEITKLLKTMLNQDSYLYGLEVDCQASDAPLYIQLHVEEKNDEYIAKYTLQLSHEVHPRLHHQARAKSKIHLAKHIIKMSKKALSLPTNRYDYQLLMTAHNSDVSKVNTEVLIFDPVIDPIGYTKHIWHRSKSHLCSPVAARVAQRPCIIFSQHTATNVRLVTLAPKEPLQVLVDVPGTITSANIAPDETLYFVKSGTIYRYTTQPSSIDTASASSSVRSWIDNIWHAATRYNVDGSIKNNSAKKANLITATMSPITSLKMADHPCWDKNGTCYAIVGGKIAQYDQSAWKTIATKHNCSGLDVARDAEILVYQTHHHGTYRLELLSLSSATQSTTVAQQKHPWVDMRISPDGSTIAAVSRDGRNTTIWIIDTQTHACLTTTIAETLIDGICWISPQALLAK